MIVRILEDAEADILEAHDWYESKRPGLGADLELCIEEALGRISYMPESYRPWHRSARRALLARFPYGLFFTIHRDTAIVVGLFHLKRNPRWLKSTIRRRKK